MVTVSNITKISQVTPEVTLFLRQLGLSNYYIIKIFDLVGDAALELTKDDPFWLLEEFPNMGFQKVDRLAEQLGVERESEGRIQAGIKYVLSSYLSQGHTYAPFQDFIEKVGGFLSIPMELLEDVLEDMAFLGKVHIANLAEKKVVYFYGYYRAECSIVGKLMELSEPEKGLPVIGGEIDFMIEKGVQKTGIKLSKNQKEAVKGALSQGVSIITGGPGTGKTTIINTIISIFEASGHKVAVAAPTGRAAKRVMETSGKYATTIHRLLEYFFDEESQYMRFGRNSESPLEVDAVIIDEASMIDLMLMEALCDAITPGTRLILVGDADQLPSVGAGNVLGDLIESDYFYTAKLKEIYRQDEEGNIVVNAHRINKGEYPEFGKDFILIEERKQEAILKKIAEMAGNIEKSELQVITPVKKGILGSGNLNDVLQKVFNPSQKEKKEISFGSKIFRVGDRVMQMKNNYALEYRCFIKTPIAKATDPFVSFSKEQMDKNEPVRTGKGVFNGEIGMVVGVNEDMRSVTVLYDDERWVEYPYAQLDEIELAYAITVHKSQGSEFPYVIIPMTWFPPMLATRSLIYTAITRGKKQVIIIGKREYLNGMVDNNTSRDRNSGLKDRIMGIYQF